MKRKPLSKTTRFEVFKRDRFTCQYCGAKAPDVVLHVDHIRPVADEGGNDILNLVTACADCNGGKGARKLDDRSAVEKQRVQIEELQERREQLEMMLAWRDDAERQKVDVVDQLSERFDERGGFIPNESGRATIRKWLRTYSPAELLEAMDGAFDAYMKFNGDEPDKDAWELAFKKIPVFASMNRQAKDKPYLPRLLYVQGILRKRFSEPRLKCVEVLEEMIEAGILTEELEESAKRATTWDEFVELSHARITEGPDGR